MLLLSVGQERADLPTSCRYFGALSTYRCSWAIPTLHRSPHLRRFVMFRRSRTKKLVTVLALCAMLFAGAAAPAATIAWFHSDFGTPLPDVVYYAQNNATLFDLAYGVNGVWASGVNNVFTLFGADGHSVLGMATGAYSS